MHSYDNQNKNWIYGVQNLDHLMGYYIYINVAQIDLIVYGDEFTVDQEIELYWFSGDDNGWNLVGYPSNAPNELEEALDPLIYPYPIGVVQWYDSSTDLWHFLTPGQDFELGRGYWIYYYGNPGQPSVTWTIPHDAIP